MTLQCLYSFPDFWQNDFPTPTIVKTALGRPLKICIVASTGMGGSGIMGSSVASKLSERGPDMHLISYRKPFRLDSKNVRTHYIPLRNYQVLEHFPL